jgi:KDO2-lipid IV(A) lauroyltransferase
VHFNIPVICVAIRRIKRGYYSVEYIPVSDNPAAEKKYYITEECSRINEQLIIDDPPYWLWTHRRWKHKPPADIEITKPYQK